MKEYNYSDTLRKALSKDAGKIDILEILNKKKLSTQDDVMQLTGLQHFNYISVFAEDCDDEIRGWYHHTSCIMVMSAHVSREDLAPHQKVVSDILWRDIKEQVLEEIGGKFRLISGQTLEDRYPEDPAFNPDVYEISDEEMTAAVQLLQKHIAEEG